MGRLWQILPKLPCEMLRWQHLPDLVRNPTPGRLSGQCMLFWTGLPVLAYSLLKTLEPLIMYSIIDVNQASSKNPAVLTLNLRGQKHF